MADGCGWSRTKAAGRYSGSGFPWQRRIPTSMPTDPVVFVVDDDDAVRDSLGVSLKLAGHAVETFDSATAFLAGGAWSRPGCLITDIRMPDMDGLELQEE